MIRGSSVSRFLNNREIKDPQTNRYICRLYGFTKSKCWLWGTFVTHSFLPNECVTNEPQRTSAGRLSASQRPRKSCDLHMINLKSKWPREKERERGEGGGGGRRGRAGSGG